MFIGTQFSNLYTAVDTTAKGRVGVCVVFVCLVFVCKYVLRHSRVSKPLNSGHASSGTFSLRSMPPRPVTDDTLTHTGSSAALRPAPLPSHGPIPFTFPPRPDLHYIFTKYHNPIACLVPGHFIESCTACITGVARVTSVKLLVKLRLD
jgi:hypothetical protein